MDKSAKDKKAILENIRSGEYLQAWRGIKDEYPAAYTVAAIAPVTGQVAAVADYADAMDRNDSLDGITAAASLIPGFKLAKHASKLAPPAFRLKSEMSSLEKAISPVVKKAPAIGKGAAAQQVSEYTQGQIKPAPQESPSASGDEEYIEAWNNPMP